MIISAESILDFIRWLHYLALSLWIGGIVFLSFIAAPAAHRSMASRTLAGQIVSGMLKRLNVVELVCCSVLLGTGFSSLRFMMDNSKEIFGLIAVIILMGSATLFYTFRLTPQLESIKERVPTLDSLSPENPDKKEFSRLHKLYVRLMSMNLLLGLTALYVSVGVLR